MPNSHTVSPVSSVSISTQPTDAALQSVASHATDSAALAIHPHLTPLNRNSDMVNSSLNVSVTSAPRSRPQLPADVWCNIGRMSDPDTLHSLALVSRTVNTATKSDRDLSTVLRQIQGRRRMHFNADTDSRGVHTVFQMERLLGVRPAPPGQPFVAITDLALHSQVTAYRALRQKVADLRRPAGAREDTLRLMTRTIQAQLSALQGVPAEQLQELRAVRNELRSSLHNFREARNIAMEAARRRPDGSDDPNYRATLINSLINVFGRLMDDAGMGPPQHVLA
jgi:hypothetical protein